MGLTNHSVGVRPIESGVENRKQSLEEKMIAIAGNPNVGKSTVFNHLTGMRQHTGNWSGKTVSNAQGYCRTHRHAYTMVDIPGTYSLMAHSAEEELARNLICFGAPDAVLVVCDATCLERNLNLVLQILEISRRAVVCVNLMDEAKRKSINIDLGALAEKLGVPVIGATARSKKGIGKLMDAVDDLVEKSIQQSPFQIQYPQAVEDAIAAVESVVEQKLGGRLPARWVSLQLLDADQGLLQELAAFLGEDLRKDTALQNALAKAETILSAHGMTNDTLRDAVVASLVHTAEEICRDTVVFSDKRYRETDRKIDHLLTGKWTGYPVMVMLLIAVFWLTIVGANYPSQLLSDGLYQVQLWLTAGFTFLGAPAWLQGVLVLGVYKVLAWVVSVMLPPMAIFFPLFTLLEDAGYLPRVAYNLDRHFQKCCACGKQALTMCMGLGCNAAGIVGCRIIDSPRERLIAILTNTFVPCNGRFPTLISIITMFLIGVQAGVTSALWAALLLTAMILLGIGMTFLVSKLLSKTLLKGVPSSFTLELPPYRKPQIGRVIVRSIFDRTLFVLGRAVVVAAPAGLLLWLMANCSVGDATVLSICAAFLDPFARLLGMDGVILIAFILGFPANELVLPIIIMAYLSQGSILELSDLESLKILLTAHGWTWITAISTMLFSLMHWPCSTTLLTIRKETQSLRWTVLAFLIPTIIGILICFTFTSITRLF